jgi:hypothetical protein
VETLVIHPGALGDVLLALPALGLLRRSGPDYVALAGKIEYLQPAARGYADRFLSIHSLPLHRLYGSFPLPSEDLNFWRSFSRIISWTGAGDKTFCRNLCGANRNVLIPAWQPGEGEDRHLSQIFIDSLEPWLGAEKRLVPPRISLLEQERARGLDWLRKSGWQEEDNLLAIHPGSGSPAKRWPLSKFQRLASELSSRSGCSILAIEGPAESGLGKALATCLPSCMLAANVPLLLLSSILTHCRGYVGNDSGIAHLATALGIPSVVVFGPTMPEHWAPLGDHVRILRDDAGFRTLSVGHVLEAVERVSFTG